MSQVYSQHRPRSVNNGIFTSSVQRELAARLKAVPKAGFPLGVKCRARDSSIV